MKLQVYIYRCNTCDKKFKEPGLIREPYGEFLLRDDKGNIAYLNTFSDHVFDEVSDILENDPQVKNIKNRKKATILHRIFSITCDLSSDHLKFEIEKLPACPLCGSSENLAWTFSYPPEIVEIDIPEVTHNTWNLFDETTKKQKVSDAIGDFLKNAKESDYY